MIEFIKGNNNEYKLDNVEIGTSSFRNEELSEIDMYDATSKSPINYSEV